MLYIFNVVKRSKCIYPVLEASLFGDLIAMVKDVINVEKT